MRERVHFWVPSLLFLTLVDNLSNLHTQVVIILEVQQGSWLLGVT